MSTNNFYYKNICIPVFIDYTEDDNYFIEDELEYFKSELVDNIKDFTDGNTKVPYDYELRSYPSFKLGEVDIYDNTGEVYATIHVLCNSGYYQGSCLDYHIEIIDEDKKETILLQKKIESKCNKIAKVLRTFGKEVYRVATFSNGEAIYNYKQ